VSRCLQCELEEGGAMQLRQEAEAPASLHVVGRPASRENHDLCGEYMYVGLHAGRAAYRKRSTNFALRYAAKARRWVIDRAGFSDSDVCAAFADNSVDACHPGHSELIWHIWENRAQTHVADAEVSALDAPAVVTLVGRTPGRANCIACGEYEIFAVHHGRPMYRQRNGSAVLRYCKPESRWLLSAASAKGNVCSAFANGMLATHPGFVELEWNFWEDSRKTFVPDPATRTLCAPTAIHVVGRAANMENGGICGTYQLAGAHEGRPLYVEPGSQKVLRYSAKTDRWLINVDGLKEPSVLSRLYQWILNGDSSTASETCNACAPARGSSHPGFCSLEWHVWHARKGQHLHDPLVRATTAPLALRVSGRDATRENCDICGDYVMAGTHGGRPAYLKSGTRTALRYWSRRWVIDREGLRCSDNCVAYVEDPDDTEHPVGLAPWCVYESSRGHHLTDRSMRVAVADDAPLALATTAGGLKRQASDAQNDAKRARWIAQLGA